MFQLSYASSPLPVNCLDHQQTKTTMPALMFVLEDIGVLSHRTHSFDVRVFYPFASSYRQSKLSSVYRQHENKKRREYGQRVREIERGSFTPLVFTTEGGMAGETTVFIKRLASMMSQKRNDLYSCVLGWIRCTVSFSLLRSSLMCLRGTRTKQPKIDCGAIAEAVAASRLDH